jgi:flagellar biosynthesis protein FliQ
MSDAYLFTLGQKTLMVTLQLAGPLLGFSLIVGIVVSIFQAATQIQDITLSFVPKIIAVVLATAIFGPWMLRSMIEFTYNLFMYLPQLTR